MSHKGIHDPNPKKRRPVTSGSVTSIRLGLEGLFSTKRKSSNLPLGAKREPLKRAEVQIQHGNQITKWDAQVPTRAINTPLTARAQAAFQAFHPHWSHYVIGYIGLDLDSAPSSTNFPLSTWTQETESSSQEVLSPTCYSYPEPHRAPLSWTPQSSPVLNPTEHPCPELHMPLVFHVRSEFLLILEFLFVDTVDNSQGVQD